MKKKEEKREEKGKTKKIEGKTATRRRKSGTKFGIGVLLS